MHHRSWHLIEWSAQIHSLAASSLDRRLGVPLSLCVYVCMYVCMYVCSLWHKALQIDIFSEWQYVAA